MCIRDRKRRSLTFETFAAFQGLPGGPWRFYDLWDLLQIVKRIPGTPQPAPALALPSLGVQPAGWHRCVCVAFSMNHALFFGNASGAALCSHHGHDQPPTKVFASGGHSCEVLRRDSCASSSLQAPCGEAYALRWCAVAPWGAFAVIAVRQLRKGCGEFAA